MSMVHLSAGINPPASEHLLSEPAIVARLAAATLPDSPVPWLWLVEDYSRIRELIEQVFEDFAGFREKIAVPGGFRLRNTASERVWQTPTGRANFRAARVPLDLPIHRAQRRTDARVFNLGTTRSHDQYNTTVYGLNDRYRGVYGQRRVVFINPEDIAHLGMKDGQWVDLLGVDEQGTEPGKHRRADKFRLVAYDIPRGCLAGYYPETNPLVPLDSYADQARTPTSKSIPVLVVRHGLAASAGAAPDATISQTGTAQLAADAVA